MRKIISYIPVLISLTFVPNLLASKYRVPYLDLEIDYYTIYQEGQYNFLRIDNNSISQIDEFIFAQGVYSYTKDTPGRSVNYVFDCKNRKFIEDKPLDPNQIDGVSSWDYKRISRQPIWKEVKNEKTSKVFNYVCNY